jgi:hypothetical protein
MSTAFQSTISTLESIEPSKFANDAERFQAKEALRKLLIRMETPFERIWALSFENPPLIAGLRICVDLGIWTKWAAIYKELTLEQIIALCETKPEANLLREHIINLANEPLDNIIDHRRTLFEAHSGTVHARRDWSRYLEANCLFSRPW